MSDWRTQVGAWLAAVTVWAWSVGAGPARGVEISVSPGSVNVVLEAGRAEGRVEVGNSGHETRTLRVRFGEVTRMGAGRDAPRRPEKEPAIKLSADAAELALTPGGRKELRIQIAQTGELAAGRYRAVLSVHAGDESAPAATGVIHVTVPAVVPVRADAITVNAEANGSSAISATLRFSVEANVPTVRMYVMAGPMTPGDGKEGGSKSVIDLDLARGVDICAPGSEGARIVHAAYQKGAAEGREQEPAATTQAVTLRSAQGAGFKDHVFVTLWWKPTEPLTPAGRYDVAAKLYVMPDPDGASP